LISNSRHKQNEKSLHQVFCKYSGALLLIFTAMSVCAQSLQTIVKGVITDARSRETMPAVTITFWGITIGTSTDNQGHYELSGKGSFAKVKISF
jgi:hypothetical protein